jgi:hypothetical protein
MWVCGCWVCVCQQLTERRQYFIAALLCCLLFDPGLMLVSYCVNIIYNREQEKFFGTTMRWKMARHKKAWRERTKGGETNERERAKRL